MKILAILPMLLMLGGCATTGDNSADPWEKYNRKVFAFNDALDRSVIKPVAKGYQAVTPDIVEQGVSNFFSNLGDVGNSVNNLLQGEVVGSGSDLLRVVINSTVGLVGLVDVATHAGLQKHQEDFGQTFAVWGVDSGPYVVLPFFGPRTVRDSFGLGFDYTVSPITYVEEARVRNQLTGLNLINTRSDLLKAESVIGNDFYDRYATLRNAYLQHRNVLVHNGNPPRPDLDEDDLIRQLEDF